MNKNLNDKERELIKLVTYFKKRAETLMADGKLSEEHQQVVIACSSLAEKLDQNADERAAIVEQRESLSKMIKDNASCPKCGRNTHLKFAGVITNEKGWKCSSYRCRRCNIQFEMTRPNNPWDMILFMEDLHRDMSKGLEDDSLSELERTNTEEMLSQLEENISKLKPVIESTDREYQAMKAREPEMAKMIHDFKNYLLIEKIKMDSWNQTMGES